MKTLKLLTMTAIVSGTIMMAVPAKAEDSSWFEQMKQSVSSWFNKDENPESARTQAYLDEVTIAVPPMTGDEAAAIEPAGGDYEESLDEAIENIPGAVNAQDEQSFNTDFTNSEGSVAAFDDNNGVDALANIEPAAGEGDAEEIADESIVVVEGESQESQDMAAEAEDKGEDMAEALDDFAQETQKESTESAEETQSKMDSVVERIEPQPMKAEKSVVEEAEEMASDAAEAVEEMTEEAVKAMKDTASDAAEAVEETTEEVVEETNEVMSDEEATEE